MNVKYDLSIKNINIKPFMGPVREAILFVTKHFVNHVLYDNFNNMKSGTVEQEMTRNLCHNPVYR